MHKSIPTRLFTLVELLVVIAIISILAALLMPMLGKALIQAELISCLNNLRQTGAAMAGYCSDERGYFPGDYYPYVSGGENTTCFWQQRLMSYVNDTPRALCCPRHPAPTVTPPDRWNGYNWFNSGTGGYAYGINHRTLACNGNAVSGWGCIIGGNRIRESGVRNPSGIIFCLDNRSSFANPPPGSVAAIQAYQDNYYKFPHGTDGINALYVDQHCRSLHLTSPELSETTSPGWLIQ
jgi:prepilin-type N-terminal cleavage/methylation domain-containing protein